jgi:hypothetical protein
MATPYEQALELYYQLRPAAIEAYNRHFLIRTPAHLQADMDAVLAPNLPKLMISDTQQVVVKDTAGNDVPGSPGTARATTQYTGYIELASL